MREKLIELLTTGKRRCWDRECTECEYDDIDPICQSKLIADFLIKNGVIIPVRCKDCSHSGYDDGVLICYEHTDFMTDEIRFLEANPDGFCSYGERKTNNE